MFLLSASIQAELPLKDQLGVNCIALQKPLQKPAVATMSAHRTRVLQDQIILTSGLLKCIREDRKAVESFLFNDAAGQGQHGFRLPCRIAFGQTRRRS
jgi:hypothetical protein